MNRQHYPAAAACFVGLMPLLSRIARDLGYALAVHGSMTTDLDLIAAPWTDAAVEASVLVEAIRASIGGIIRDVPHPEDQSGTYPVPRPHGRLCWSIYFGGGPYIDLSVIPRIINVSDIGGEQ